MKIIDLLKLITKDLNYYSKSNKSLKINNFLFSLQFLLIFTYRLSHYLKTEKKLNRFRFLIRYINYLQHSKTSCQINSNAIIGNQIKFPHPTGIVIGKGVIIENNVSIYQNVTIGGKGNPIGYPKIERPQ